MTPLDRLAALAVPDAGRAVRRSSLAGRRAEKAFRRATKARHEEVREALAHLAAMATPRSADDLKRHARPTEATSGAGERPHMSHTLTAQDFALLDAGTYGVEWKTISDPEMGTFGRFVKIGFGIYDPTDWTPLYTETGDEFTLVAQASYKLGQKTKLRGWAEATLGRGFEPGEEFDLDTLIGKRALAAIVQVQGSQGGTFNNVEGLSPLPKKRAPTAGNGAAKRPVAAVAASEDDSDADVPF